MNNPDRSPTITAQRRGRDLEFRCPHCGATHRHGACRGCDAPGDKCYCPPGSGDGDRAAHCDGWPSGGYNLREETSAEWAERLRRAEFEVLSAPCKTCGARSGDPCTGAAPHAARRKAAATPRGRRRTALHRFAAQVAEAFEKQLKEEGIIR